SMGFGVIRNNTALKRSTRTPSTPFSFGVIRNNTALKPRRLILSRHFVIAPFVSARLQFQMNSSI
ncbi:hypothetical protein ACEF17_09555, partial [Streptococcus hyovaginalis]